MATAMAGGTDNNQLKLAGKTRWQWGQQFVDNNKDDDNNDNDEHDKHNKDDDKDDEHNNEGDKHGEHDNDEHD